MVTRKPRITVTRNDTLYFTATAACGQSWVGMVLAPNDVAGVVVRALDHSEECPRCCAEQTNQEG